MPEFTDIKNNLLVRHITQTDLIQCGVNSTVDDAIQLMSEHRIGSVIICADSQPVGIISRGDTIALVQKGVNIQNALVDQYMSAPVITVASFETVDQASELLQKHNLRHLVVVDQQDELYGILSETDIVNSQGIEHDLFLRSVKDITNHNPLRLPINLTLQQAIQKLQDAKQTALLVTNEKDAFGILTAKDVIDMLAKGYIDTRLGDCCAGNLISIKHDQSLYSARKIFRKHGFHHLAVKDDSGLVTGLISYHDILQRAELDYVRRLRDLLNERDQALELSMHNLKLADRVIDASLEAIIITDSDARILRVNPAFTEITGYLPEEVEGKKPSLLSSGRHNPEFYSEMWKSLEQQGQWQGEVWNKRKDGTIYPEWLNITAIKDDDDNVSQYAAIFSDRTEIKKSEARIKRLAYFDELTRLPNRKLFQDRLQLALGFAKEHQHQVALAYIDLDFFQRINDLYGHETGDQVLVEVGRRIELLLEEGDTAARFGGDEFNLILTNVDNTQSLTDFLNQILRLVNQPILIHGNKIETSISIGVSIYPNDADNAENLLRCADAAVHQAKDIGRNSFRFFSSEQHQQIHSRYQLGNDLLKALTENQFELYYQPKVSTATRQPVGAEVLLRWNHPTLGFVPPDQFIPLAEDIGLIDKIGNYVLCKAAKQSSQWLSEGIEVPLAINVSAKQMLDPNLANRIINALEHEKVPPHLFSIELTETCFLHCLEETQAIICKLHDVGIKVAIDDFGTGYSSLSYIRNMSLDVLKIDRSFLINIENSDVDRRIVSSIIEMSHAMELQVVAEGVEIEEQFALLSSLQCDQIQGYLLARPMPITEFIDWYKLQQQD